MQTNETGVAAGTQRRVSPCWLMSSPRDSSSRSTRSPIILSMTKRMTADATVLQAPEVQVEQQEDDQQRHRHDHRETILRTFQILELAAPLRKVSSRSRPEARTAVSR
jgi:hypothetical protein